MSSPLQPLFTTCPLILPSPSTSTTAQPLFVTSPIEEEGYSKHASYPSVPPSPLIETLSFAKVPIPSTTVSTDSEAFSSSDWTDSRRRSGTTSPSLITCLFQSASIMNPNDNNNNKNNRKTDPSPNRNGSKPILRRDLMSTSASEDNRDNHYPFHPSTDSGFGLGISKLPLQDTESEIPVLPALKKRPSVLTFAVSSPRAGPSRSTSVSPTSTSSYANAKLPRSPCVKPNWGKVKGRVENEEIEEEEENDNDNDDGDEENYMIDSPLPIPGCGQDESEEEDEGYVEDEEGGFTSDEEENHHEMRSKPSWADISWTNEYVNNTPKRRSANIDQMEYPTSTDDCAITTTSMIGHGRVTSPSSNLRGRKVSISIVANTKPSSSRCTRHRSPPPPIRASTISVAPPAARSPSAADLCRRRGSASIERSDSQRIKRGWKSDDHSLLPDSIYNQNQNQIQNHNCNRRGMSSRPIISHTNSFQLPSASASTSTSTSNTNIERKGSLPTTRSEKNRQTSSILKKQHHNPSSIPMQRSSGQTNKIPPKTPPLDVVKCPTSTTLNKLSRTGSAPVQSTITKNGAGNNHHDGQMLDIIDGNCHFARSAIGYEEEEMAIAHANGHGHGHGLGHGHGHNRGIRVI
ncbi:uncharacterized protein IL334_006960 [Kwoniella shivajii]|uniref:Uncharacterized protein n=1 Tax=Kwoniella shivajii TaxID=564305 RepID=A0ABZ1D7E0_9TREE|nr:hypothetical protein IL334_006960 [Kwoniella shivajii]